MMRVMKVVISGVMLIAGMGATSAREVALSPAMAEPNHYAMFVADNEVSARFYASLFGLEAMPQISPNIRWLRAGNFEIHLINGRTAPVATPRAVHFAWRVSDLAALTARLDAMDHAWGNFAGTSHVIDTRADGVQQVFLQDPDGYWLEVNQVAVR